MTRLPRTLPLAVVAGIAVAVGLSVAAPGSSTHSSTASRTGPAAGAPGAPVVSRPWEASRRGPLAPQPKRLPIDDRAVLGAGAPAIEGTVQPVQTVADPAGGAPWALRTFQRRGPGNGRTWCAQLGRQIDGEFVWIKAGDERAHRIAPTESRSTICANRPKWMPWADAPQWMPWASAPTAGMAVGALPDRSPDDPAARLAATVAWGVVDGDDAEVQIQRGGDEATVSVRAHGFLRVQPGTVLPTRATFTFAGPDGAPETIPADTFPEQTKLANDDSRAAGSGDPVKMVRATPEELGLAPSGALTQVASLGDTGRSKGQQGLFTRRASGGREACVAGPTDALGGHAVRHIPFTGLLVMDVADCRPVDRRADRGPVSMGSGWSTTFDERNGTYDPSAVQDEQRRIERRLPMSDGGVLIATPRGTKLLEVTSPVGVKTVRVTDARVTWIGWQGQPQVQKALTGDGRGDPNMVYRALDADGRQIGETTYAWPPEWARTTQAERQRPRR